MKSKILVIACLLTAVIISASAQKRQSTRSTSGGADIGYLVRTFLKASKNPNYSIPYDLYRGNRSLTVNNDDNPSRYDTEWSYVYGYVGKITAIGRYLSTGLNKKWNIVLSGPQAGAVLLEMNSSEIDGLQMTSMKNKVVNAVPCTTLKKQRNGGYYKAYLYSAKNGYVMIYFSWGASAVWMTIYASGDWYEINRVWNENIN